MQARRSDQFLLRTILKHVSRSFYLTLAVLPKAVRSQVGLAYLFARAADTIADTGQLDDQTRLHCLHQLKAQFVEDHLDWGKIQEIKQAVISYQHSSGEQALLEELAHCFSLYERLPQDDRLLIAQLLPTLIEGMEFDMRQFPQEGSSRVHVLKTMEDLDYYTYAVAGCVGEFWTQIMCAHLPRLAPWDPSVMIPLGIRYGKGLQLVNILRDVSSDLHHGRCYIPAAFLQEVGLCSKDLLDEQSMTAFRPIFRRLIVLALEHLDQGWRYTMAIPRREVRLRLACMWPVLIGVRTLQVLLAAPNILNSATPLKISRAEIYRLMGLTTLSGGSGVLGTAYWGYLRKKVL